MFSEVMVKEAREIAKRLFEQEEKNTARGLRARLDSIPLAEYGDAMTPIIRLFIDAKYNESIAWNEGWSEGGGQMAWLRLHQERRRSEKQIANYCADIQNNG